MGIINKQKMKAVKIGDLIAVVDDEDFELVNSFSWYVPETDADYAHSRTCVFNGVAYTGMHRLIMRVSDPKKVVDHINGNRRDNRKDNLRVCNSVQNGRKVIQETESDSIYKGVKGIEISGISYWYASVSTDVGHIGLGFFPKTKNGEIDAALAVDRYAFIFHKEHAYVNIKPIDDCSIEAKIMFDTLENKKGQRRNIYTTKTVGDGEYKNCTRCLERKKLSDFYPRSRNGGTYDGQCKQCHSKKDKARRALKPKKEKPTKIVEQEYLKCEHCQETKLINEFRPIPKILSNGELYNFTAKKCLKCEDEIKIQDLDGEQWLPLKGYEGLYVVSNMGRVKDIDPKTMYEGERLLTPINSYGNAFMAQTVYIEQNRKNIAVHYLIADNFIENTESRFFVKHINGDKKDNRLYNLEWSDESENKVENFGSLNNKGSKSIEDKIFGLIIEHKMRGEKDADIANLLNIEFKIVRRALHALKKNSFAQNC